MRDTLGKILHDLLTDHAALGRLRVFEENPKKVLEALKRGELDCVDGTAWSFADSFFAFHVGISGFLPWAASTFPTSRSVVPRSDWESRRENPVSYCTTTR
jgi:hypothetical protein